MFRRSIIAFTVAIVAMLVFVAPTLAGGWAIVTLDSLPREVRTGQSFQIGFVVRQHGKTPTNQDLDGKPLVPVIVAHKQDVATPSGSSATQVAARSSIPAKGEETIRIEARQEGAIGHYVAAVTFPSDGVWAWQIVVPTYYVQNGGDDSEGNAAILVPLTVLPPVPAPQSQPAEATLLGFDRSMIRWIALGLILLAAFVALYTRRDALGWRQVARSR